MPVTNASRYRHLSKITLQRTFTLPGGVGPATNFEIVLTFIPTTPPPDRPELKPNDRVYVPPKLHRK